MMENLENRVAKALYNKCLKEREINEQKGFYSLPLVGMRASDFYQFNISESEDDINDALRNLENKGFVCKGNRPGYFIWLFKN